jgi:hypothetical protein
MTNIACAREQDVLDVLAARRWPGRCEPELEEHIRVCGICGDLAAAAAALLDEHECAWGEARVPASGVVWWRAQVRAREEAARAAARPIAFVQGVAASCAVWVAFSLLRAFPPRTGLNWRGWVTSLAGIVPDFSAVAASVPGGLSFLIVVGASLFLAPVVLFIGLREALREE